MILIRKKISQFENILRTRLSLWLLSLKYAFLAHAGHLGLEAPHVLILDRALFANQNAQFPIS